MLPPLQSDRPLPPIVALCGPAGVGKTTVARALARLAPTIDVDVTLGIAEVLPGSTGKMRGPLRLPTEGIVVPLAHPLKQMLRALGVPAECLTGSPTDKERPLDLLCGRSARRAMQTLGTEWGRECIHPELWLRAWEHHVRIVASADYPHSLVIVDDVRFDNEVDYLRRLGAVVIRVYRPGVQQQESGHASERGVTRIHASVMLHERHDRGEVRTEEDRNRLNTTRLLDAVVRTDARLRPDDSRLRRLLKQAAPVPNLFGITPESTLDADE